MNNYLPKKLTFKELCNDVIFNKYYTIDIDAVLNLTTLKSNENSEMLFLFSPKDLKTLHFVPSINLEGGAFLMLFNNGLEVTIKNEIVIFKNSEFM